MTDASDEGKTFKLSANEKVLLHLKEQFIFKDKEDAPVGMTQEGISRSTGIRTSHVPRTLKKLKEEGLVDEGRSHVEGKKRRFKTYFLTDAGLRRAQSIRESISDRMITLMKGNLGERVRLDDLVERLAPNIGFMDIISSMSPEGDIQHEDLIKKEVKGRQASKLDGAPALGSFIDRENELKELGHLFDLPVSKMVVVYGNQGFGRSALVSKFVDGKDDWNRLWIKIDEDTDLEEIEERIKGFMKELGSPLESIREKGILIDRLKDKKILIVIDDYFDVKDEVVEFFSDLVDMIDEIGLSRFIIVSREDTPSYNRFYEFKHKQKGSVQEMHIQGLSEDVCKDVLGRPDIDPEALRRIYLFTKGRPSILRMISDKDKEGLKNAGYSTEQVHLMFFLCEEKKKE